MQVGQFESFLVVAVFSGVVKSVQDSKKGKTSNHDRGVSEEENNESQKQKVFLHLSVMNSTPGNLFSEN